MEDLQFNMRYGDYEVKACPRRLVKLRDDEKNETVDFIKHTKDKNGQHYVYSIGYFRYDEREPGWEFYFVGERFTLIEDEAVFPVWQMLKAAYKVLDAWKRSEISEM